VQPGITTEEIDAQVHDLIVKKGAYPSPLGYKGFPRSICTSVNDVAVHGIPDDVKLQEGDVISIDVTVYLNGYHGDTAATYIVGKPTSERAKELVVAAYKCREAGILACGPGKPFKDIGAAIEYVFCHSYLFNAFPNHPAPLPRLATLNVQRHGRTI